MHSNSYGLNTGGGTSNDHIHEKLNKAYSMLGIIKRNFKHMDNVYMYKSLVRSIVQCNSSVWSHRIWARL